MTDQRTNIAILLFDGVEELDAIGPWEVFQVAADRQPGLDCFTVAETTAPVTCTNRLRVLPDHDLAGAPDIDIILVPGGRGTEGVLAKPAMLEWIAATAAQCGWVTSVCTGAELLVAAGPAKGKRVTTYHAAVAGLRAAGGAAEVIDDARWVRDGNVVSAAGVSAGIDMALWLLGELYQPDFARQIQRDIEYDPQPPYADVG